MEKHTEYKTELAQHMLEELNANALTQIRDHLETVLIYLRGRYQERRLYADTEELRELHNDTWVTRKHIIALNELIKHAG